jgi:hypothetical protein
MEKSVDVDDSEERESSGASCSHREAAAGGVRLVISDQ